MAVFYLKNSRAPSGKVVPITVSLDTEVIYTTPSPNVPSFKDLEGEDRYVLVLSTPEVDINGDPIPPEVINIVSEDTVHLELEAALGRIGAKIDWGNLSDDTRPPRLVDIIPSLDQTTGVPITTNIIVKIQEKLPSSGIDLSTLNMSLNGFTVISGGVTQPGYNVDLSGNIFDLTIIHRPKKITT